MTTALAPTWWSWSTIIEHADRLGVPHFQRGAVWEAGNRVALLESIFEGSPCGSFVLWSAGVGAAPAAHGVPLRGQFGSGVAPLWLVDGQQRCRSMVGVFSELVGASTRPDGWSLVRPADIDALRRMDPGARLAAGAPALDDEAEADDAGRSVSAAEAVVDRREPPVWFVVLPAMTAFELDGAPLFGVLSDARSVRRGTAFRRVRPPARRPADATDTSRTLPPMALGAMPLAALLSPASVFADPQTRDALRALLEAVQARAVDARQLEELDALAPWGPLFLTGHAFAFAADDTRPAQPLRWADWIDELRRADALRPTDRRGPSADKERADELGRADRLLEALKALCTDPWAAVLARFRAMWTAPCFAVGTLPLPDISAAIDAYVRINRAGVRVRVEERALALLSRARPALTQDLRDYHALRDDLRGEGDGRAQLAHADDRTLGFEVWMRTVTRYAALSVNGVAARLWLECAAVDKLDFSYRLGRVRGADAGGADALGRAMLARDYEHADDLVKESVERATAALLLIDRVLREELHLDHRMARPAARGLLPLIELLYFVPTEELRRLADDAGLRAALGRMLQWTALAPYLNQGQLEAVILAIHRAPQKHGSAADQEGAGPESATPAAGDTKAARGETTKKADSAARAVPCWPERGADLDARLRAGLVDWQRALLKLWRGDEWTKLRGEGAAADTAGARPRDVLDAASQAWFRREVEGARSLQHAAVGWLYALERRGGARELCWAAQVEANKKNTKHGVPGPEGGPLAGGAGDPRLWAAERLRGTTAPALYPEKQHIVPFSAARVITGAQGTRATASAANVIGNLTWLSHRQNHFEALSDRWSELDPTRPGEEENLTARGMRGRAAESGDRDALAVYGELRALVTQPAERGPLSKTELAAAKALFEELCAARQRWMVERMRAWLDAKLSAEVGAWLSIEG